MENILNSLQEVVVEKPSDVIMRQIKTLIATGQLRAGDKLPSERKLSDRFGVGRTYVRDAIKQLEFYGVLRTLPQSGTVVADLELPTLQHLITDLLGTYRELHKLSPEEEKLLLKTCGGNS